MSDDAQAAGPRPPDIARFGAALLRDAEELYADESSARYRVRAPWAELLGFYRAVYGKTKGMLIEEMEPPPPKPRERNPPGKSFAVAVGPACKEAEFSLIVVQKAAVADDPLAHDVLVVARGDDDLGGYADPSPWMRARR